MDENAESTFWGLLHDGGLEAITGTVPGTVSVRISIQYLRQQFPTKGAGFKIDLLDCKRFVYQEYDSSPLEDFDAIVALEPEIVSAEKGTESVIVNCVMGTLTIDYGAASIYLDSGAPVSFDELTTASRTYWDDWAARSANHK
ncbi:hypothetical protein IM543_05190 [Massilia sp. UMI-21]|nr:hypothetical protein IM543_05190 [Massilia sp. UMI-21]